MKAKEYLESIGEGQVTFVITKSVKDKNSPFYHYEYETTPIYSRWEVLRDKWIDKYIVINANHPPIDITGHWVRAYNKGHLKCAMLTTENDLYTHYSEKQAKSMIAYYDREVREQLKGGDVK